MHNHFEKIADCLVSNTIFTHSFSFNSLNLNSILAQTQSIFKILTRLFFSPKQQHNKSNSV
jgi:hypothetical protein